MCRTTRKMGGATLSGFGKTRKEALEKLESKIKRIFSEYQLEPDTKIQVITKETKKMLPDIATDVFNIYEGKNWPEDAKFCAIVHVR